jgi:hypothetical protein
MLIFWSSFIICIVDKLWLIEWDCTVKGAALKCDEHIQGVRMH